MRDYSRLLKPNWYASDIKAFYDISEAQAQDIKNKVLNEVGTILIDVHAQRPSVCADEVIKAMGGKSRLEELQIYEMYLRTQN